MNLEVDSDLCQGHGRCYVLHPELFEADSSGFSVVKDVEITEDNREAADDAVGVCPEAAIRLNGEAR